MQRVHRTYMCAAAALALTAASAAVARTWKGSNGTTYETLEVCQEKSKSCKPVGRMVKVNGVADIGRLESTRQNFRLARGAVDQPNIYFSLGWSQTPPVRGGMFAAAAEPKKTHTCHNEKYGTYHKPPCKTGEIEMDVYERQIAVGTGGVYEFDRSGAYSIGTFSPVVTVNPVGTGTVITRPRIDATVRAADQVNTGTVLDSIRVDSTVQAADPPK